MYLIIVYDIEVKRVSKIHKHLKRYLNWIQNSVFEGEIGLADYISVKKQLKKMINKNSDSIIIFKFNKKYHYEREIIGIERNELTSIV